MSDSAQGATGRFTPGSHLAIHPREIIDTETQPLEPWTAPGYPSLLRRVMKAALTCEEVSRQYDGPITCQPRWEVTANA